MVKGKLDALIQFGRHCCICRWSPWPLN